LKQVFGQEFATC